MMLVLVLCLFAAAFAADDELKVWSIVPSWRYGSTEGGTLLRLQGTGFYRSGRESVLTVFLGTEICNIIHYYSSDSELWCYTPPMVGTNSVVQISISVTGVDRANVYPLSTTFRYHSSYTPRLDFVPRGGGPGSRLYFQGFLQHSSSDRNVEQFDIRIGGARCDVDDVLNEDLSLATGNLLHYKVRCYTPEQLEPGRHNVSFSVDDPIRGYGKAVVGFYETQVDMTTGEQYHFTVHPHIDTISSHEGGTAGGSIVTIKGRGFSNAAGAAAKTSVMLAGVPCSVITATRDTIVCRTGPLTASGTLPPLPPHNVTPVAGASEPAYIPGGRGFRHALYRRNGGGYTSAWNPALNPDYPLNPLREFTNTDGLRHDERDQMDNFLADTLGFFVPPISANYSFLMTGDDYHWLELDLDRVAQGVAEPSPAVESGLARVSGCDHHEPDWADCNHLMTPKRFLEEGKPVLFRARQVEGHGNDWFSAGVRIHLEDHALVHPQPPSVMAARAKLVAASPWQEEQHVSITAIVRRETHEIVVTNVQGGRWTISAAAGGTGRETSAQLAWDASSTQVRDQVRDLYSKLSVPSWTQTSCSRSTLVGDVYDAATNSTAIGVVVGFSYSCSINAPSAVERPVLLPRGVSLERRDAALPPSVSSRRTQSASAPLSGSYRLRIRPLVDIDAELARRTAAGENVTRDVVAADDATNWTSSIDINSGDGTVAARLGDLGFSVTVAGWGYTGDGRTYRVRFSSPTGDIPEILVDTSRVEGELDRASDPLRPGWSTTERIKGAHDVFYPSIPADFIRAAIPVHQDRLSVAAAAAAVMQNRSTLGSRAVTGALELRQNGVLASCDHFLSDATAWPRPAGNCEYTYAEAATPMLAALAVSHASTNPPGRASRSVLAGDTITVTGNGFLAVSPGLPRLFPNGTDIDTDWFTRIELDSIEGSCVLVSATETSATCTVSHVPAGNYTVRVVVGKGKGLAAASPSLAASSWTTRVVYGVVVSGFAPLEGSVAGGTHVTVTGTGFASSADAARQSGSVLIGGLPCKVLRSTPSQLTCEAPSQEAAAAAAERSAAGSGAVMQHAVLVVASSAGVSAAATASFTTKNSLTANVTAVFPHTVSEAFSAEIRISTAGPVPSSLADVGSASAALAVRFGGRPCYVRASSPSGEVTCQLPRASSTEEQAASSGVAMPRTAAEQAAATGVAPALRVIGTGNARVVGGSASLLETAYRLQGVSPASISMRGGAVLTLTGAGFLGPDGKRGDERIKVSGPVSGGPHGNRTGSVNADCVVIAAHASNITCRLGLPVFPGWYVTERTSAGIPATKTTVSLSINNVPAPQACGAAATSSPCALQLDPAQTPQVTSTLFDASSNSMIIHGSGLDIGPGATGAVDVSIGGLACAIRSASATLINCSIADDREGTVEVHVTVPGKGSANYTTQTGKPFTHYHELRLDSMSHARISRAGGAIVDVLGYGFETGLLSKYDVFFTGTTGDAEILAATHRRLTLRMPAFPGSGERSSSLLLDMPARVSADTPVVLEARSRQLASSARANGGRLLSSSLPPSSHPMHGADLHQELLATPAHHQADPSAGLHLEGAPVLRLSGAQVRTAVDERSTATRAQVDAAVHSGRLHSLSLHPVTDHANRVSKSGLVWEEARHHPATRDQFLIEMTHSAPELTHAARTAMHHAVAPRVSDATPASKVFGTYSTLHHDSLPHQSEPSADFAGHPAGWSVNATVGAVEPEASRLVTAKLEAEFSSSPSTRRALAPLGVHASHPAEARRLAAATAAVSRSLVNAIIYDDSVAFTPRIVSLSPSMGTRGTVVTISGSGLLPDAVQSAVFSASDPASRVIIGAAECTVYNTTANWTDSSITCAVGNAYGGTHDAAVHVRGKGQALRTGSVRFAASAAVASVSAPPQVSFNGGALVTFRGTGFPTITPGYEPTDEAVRAVMPAVRFCDEQCQVVQSSFTELVCRAPNVTTRASASGLWDTAPAPLHGRPFGEQSRDDGTAAFAFDGNPATPVYPPSDRCTVGIDLGPSRRAVVTRLRYFPLFRETSTWANAVFQGALDASGPWTDIHRVTGHVNEGWNWQELIQIPGVSEAAPEGLPPSAVAMAPVYRYLRAVAANANGCVNEVEFVGFSVSAEADSNGGSCTASFHLSPGSSGGSAAVAMPLNPGGFRLNYTLSATPIVTDVAPNNGTALGGTVVRVSGTGFAAAAGQSSAVTVSFNGVPCTVQSVDSSGATCITGKRDRIRPVAVQVLITGAGRAAVNQSRTYFRYLDKWSSLTTWLNQQPPVDGDTVIVPHGQAVLMDVSPPRLFLFLIEGEVIFDRRDLSLDASYIWVNGGRLEVGTEAEPFTDKATITLHGDRWKDIELPMIGSKVLAVTDRNMGQTRRTKDGFVVIPSNIGHLDLHGIPRKRTWCRIAADAVPGSTDLVLSEDVDWAVGDRLVITTSSRSYTHAEELEVAAVVGPRHLRLAEPFARFHAGALIDGSPYGHRPVDLRAAVGLLSRNVVVQGDSGSYAQYFGAHTMAANGGIYRLENIELRNMGQAGILGRYSTHHHMSGAFAANSYVSSNSIHHSSQRIATIHGTRYYTVKHNVGYHVHGHSVFVEDGAERFNRIEENLILWTMRCFSCLKSDTKPANFWMAGPNQYHRHNYAGGSASEGFWYELPGTPHGPSATPLICPVHDHVGEFFNNTATAAGLHGLRLYPTVLPRKDPCDEASGPLPMYYVNFTSFRNGGHGIFGKKNGDLHHINPILVENSGADLFWTKLEEINFDWNPHVVNLLAIAQPTGTYSGSKVGLHAPQNEYFYVSGATFVNYGETGAIAGCAKCDSQTDMKQGAYTARFEGLRFINTDRRVKWTAPFKQIFWDLDGSLTDKGPDGGWVTPFRAHNLWPGKCERPMGTRYDGGIVCDDSVVVRRLSMDQFSPNELQHQDLAVHAEGFGTNDVAYREKETGGWVWPAVAGRQYTLFHRSLIDFRSYAMRYSDPPYVNSHSPAGRMHWGRGKAAALAGIDLVNPVPPVVAEWVSHKHNWTDYRDHYEVHYPQRPASDTYATERLPTDRGYFRGDSADPGPPLPILAIPNLPRSGVIQGSVRAPNPLLDQMGTGRTNRTTREFEYVLNDNNITLEHRFLRHKVFVYAAQCPRVGERRYTTCAATGGPDYGAAVEPWSLPSSWDDGRVPEAGDDVIIPPSRHILLDVPSVSVNNLRVLGQLTFDVSIDISVEAANIEVRGRMRVGTPEQPYLRKAFIRLSGTRTTPSAPIIHDKLWLGNKVLSVVGRLEMVGKPVAVAWTRLASTAAAGTSRLRLTSPATGWAAGETITITPTEYGPDQLETMEVESISSDGLTVQLKSNLRFTHFAGDVDAATPGNAAGTTGGTVHQHRLAAAVGHLSRNIVFEGIMSGPDDTYGAHVYVAEVPNPEPLAQWTSQGKSAADWTPVVHTGSALLRGVEFRNNGQAGLEAERGGLYLEYGLAAEGTDNPVNEIADCAFSNSHNYGIFARHTRHLRILRNVIHSAARSAVDLDSGCTNATLRSNLIAGVRRSVDAASGWAVPRAGIALDVVPAEASNNVVGGSHDSGFTVRLPWCTTAGQTLPISVAEATAGPGAAGARARDLSQGAMTGSVGTSPFWSNEAHGVVVGAFLLSDVTGQSRAVRCRQWSGFTVWKASHVGVLTVDQSANLILDRIRVFDSHIGVSLNFFRLGTTKSYAHVLNSVIAGTTAASQSCAHSVDCRAVGETDVVPLRCNSVLGTAFRHTGLMTSQYTNRGKTCEHDFLPFCYPKNKPERMCSMPWEKRYGLPGTRHAELHVRDTVFAHFADEDCGRKSRAVIHNPTQVDFVPPMHFRGVAWHQVNESSRFHFDYAPTTDGKCHGKGCDGFFHIVVHDEDGSTTGLAGGSVIGNNPELAAPFPYCSANADWPGFRCPGEGSTPGSIATDQAYTLRNFVFESVSSADRGHRRLGPLKVERPVPGTARTRNVSSIGPIDDGCAKRFHFAQFNYVAQPNVQHQIRLVATMSANMRLHYNSADPNEATLAALFVQRPNVVDLFVNGRQVQMNQDAAIPTLASPDGEYVFDPQGRRLHFTMRGNAQEPQRFYDIRRRPAVQLNMTLAVSIDDFTGDRLVENLAVLLSIDRSRIKIVDVQPGSVAVTTAILDAAEPTTDAAETVNQVKRLAEVAKQVIEVATQQDFSQALGFEVQAMDMDISRPSLVEAPQDGGNSNDTNFNATALREAGINVAELAETAPSVTLPDEGSTGGAGGGSGDSALSLEQDLQAYLRAEGLPDNADIEEANAEENGAGTGGGGGLQIITPPEKSVPAPSPGPSAAMIAGIVCGVVAAGLIVVAGVCYTRHRGPSRAAKAAAIAGKTAAEPKVVSTPGVEFASDNPTWKGKGVAAPTGITGPRNPALSTATFGGKAPTIGLPPSDGVGLRSSDELRGTFLKRGSSRGQVDNASVGSAVDAAPPGSTPLVGQFGPVKASKHSADAWAQLQGAL